MAVIYNGPLPDGETATNDLGVRKYTRQFGLSTTASEGPYTVGSNNNLPRIGSVHYEDAQAWCRSLTVARAGGKDRNNWTVTANYDSSLSCQRIRWCSPHRSVGTARISKRWQYSTATIKPS